MTRFVLSQKQCASYINVCRTKDHLGGAIQSQNTLKRKVNIVHREIYPQQTLIHWVNLIRANTKTLRKFNKEKFTNFFFYISSSSTHTERTPHSHIVNTTIQTYTYADTLSAETYHRMKRNSSVYTCIPPTCVYMPYEMGLKKT